MSLKRKNSDGTWTTISGRLPLADNLTTESASIALTAKQGCALSTMLGTKTEIIDVGSLPVTGIKENALYRLKLTDTYAFDGRYGLTAEAASAGKSASSMGFYDGSTLIIWDDVASSWAMYSSNFELSSTGTVYLYTVLATSAKEIRYENPISTNAVQLWNYDGNAWYKVYDSKKITYGTADPSGGNDGDIYIKYS